MHHVELRTRLDQAVLDDILELLDATTAIEGHRPVGEHKYAHLKVGAREWVGIMAYHDDHLAGYAHTRWNEVGTQPRMAVEVVVHPAHRDEGVAETLLDEARELLARAGGGTMFLWVHRVEDPHTTLAAQLGFRVQRELAFMTRPLPDAPPVPGLPEGVTLRPFTDADTDAFLAVNNAAFKGHPENGDWDRATFAERRDRPWFDPDGVILAWRDDHLLGFHWTKWHTHAHEDRPAHAPVGEVYVLAVHPDAQGLGLGRALLRAGLAHLHGRGCRQATLYVDCASTGAVALYASEGFELAYREVCYEDHLPPAGRTRPRELFRPA